MIKKNSHPTHPRSKASKADVSIIILNYNAEFFLRKTLASIMMQKGINCQTIVVDNHSSDNSLAMVKKEFPSVKIVRRHTSEGFSAGNNAGLPFATADTILFFNPDIAFTKPDDLKRCYDKYYSTPKIGLLTARVNLVVNGEIDATCHRGFPTPWAAFTHFTGLERLFPNSPLFAKYTQSYKGYDTEHEVDAVGGMFMLLSRKVGEQIGWWDEDYPLYGEDIEFSYQVKAQGFKNLYWPEVVVEHYKGATTGMSKSSKKVTSASKATTRRVRGWSIQAMETFYRKHYASQYPFFVNWLVYLGIKLLKFYRLRLA